MIKVRILGKGLIPRGYGLAPRKEPLEVDWNFLNILLNNGSFKIQGLDIDKKEFVEINLANAKKMYELLSKKKPSTVQKVEAKVVKPVEVKVEQPVVIEESKVEEHKVEEVIPVVEEIKIEEEKQSFDRRNKFDKKKNKYRHQEEAIELTEVKEE